MDIHSKALDSIFGDLDDIESKKMFGEPDGDEGTSITITITPGGVSTGSTEEGNGLKAPEEMCEGGVAKMSEGGMVEKPEAVEDFSLPPYLRKKKK
jgi:hypothetical protein